MEEILRIELFCPNCKKRVKVKRYDVELQWNHFGIGKTCEHCNHKIDISYQADEIEELINKRSE